MYIYINILENDDEAHQEKKMKKKEYIRTTVIVWLLSNEYMV